MQSLKKHTSVVTTGLPDTPDLPCAMVLTAYLRALPGDRAVLPPSLRGNRFPRNLTPASGRQDHTILPSAWMSLVNDTFASIASRPAFRDDREPPLVWNRTARRKPLIWGGGQGLFGKSEIVLIGQENFLSARMLFS